jgi:SagB-type dehydrogenase family enzyme
VSAAAPPDARAQLWPHFDLSAAPGVRLHAGPEAALVCGRDALSLGALPDGCAATLRRLTVAPLTREARHVTLDGGADRLALALALDLLETRGWLSYSVGGASPALVAHPCGEQPQLAPPMSVADLDDGAHCRLSRFCHVRVGAAGPVVVSPLSGFELRVPDERVWRLLATLAEPQRRRDAVGTGPDAELWHECLRLLHAIGVVTTGDEASEAVALRYWEFHDLLFHTESREGFRRKAFGGTYRFGDKQPGPLDPPCRGEPVALAAAPTEAHPRGHLFELLERRRSVRETAAEPCSAQQLGELLFHSARTTGAHETDYGTVQTRPYPSGGAIHELGLYLVVNRVSGLDADVYRYRPTAHELDRLGLGANVARRLSADAAAATLRSDLPDVLVVVTARLPRLTWKYEAIAYSLVLKHVGVLIATMYLVATALELAPCAVGGGDARLFAEVTSVDPLAEPAVGELTLGALPR